MYGLINAAVVLPVMMSFGTIIYHDEAFSPYLPTLIKLTLISSMVHQLCFSTFSSLPYAIGQVQDAGLIFLSAMSTMVSDYTNKHGYDDDHMLATATVGLSLCTAILGVGLIIIGKARLASYVQLLPTAVVGGYLAFIGWFCGQSGVGLMAGVEITNLPDWGLILTRQRLMLTLPGIVGGLFVYTAARKLRHMAVLPMCMLTIIGLFYVAMFLSGTTVDEARDIGWITKANPSGPWQETWKFIRFENVVWSALPQLTVTLLSMTMVVALSSSLDIAAIELELNQKLDYDNELMTVGLSNLVSGATGGYTGSYIFSQTIFTLRSGVRDRFTGYTVAFCEALIVVAPFPVIAYIPKMFFGSLLVMICTDLMIEWLWEVRHKLTNAEYCVCLGTFAIIMVIGVEWGILAGIALDWGVRRVFNYCGEEDESASKIGSLEDGATAEEKQSLVV
jgi:MFS superfamily sulfate permease-like transporter